MTQFQVTYSKIIRFKVGCVVVGALAKCINDHKLIIRQQNQHEAQSFSAKLSHACLYNKSAKTMYFCLIFDFYFIHKFLFLYTDIPNIFKESSLIIQMIFGKAL